MIRHLRHFLCLLAQLGPGIQLQIVFEFCLTSWAAQEVVNAFMLDYNVSFAAIDTLAAYGVFE